MNWLKLAAVLAVLAVLSAGAWALHDSIWKSGAASVQAKWDTAVAAAKEAASETYRINQRAKENALEVRTKQIMANVAAADRARIASERLLSTSDRSLRAAESSHAACVISATTHAELFTDCRKEYRELGQKADGHVADIEALTGSWPAQNKE